MLVYILRSKFDLITHVSDDFFLDRVGTFQSIYHDTSIQQCTLAPKGVILSGKKINSFVLGGDCAKMGISNAIHFCFEHSPKNVHPQHLLVYWVTPLVGAAFASVLQQYINRSRNILSKFYQTSNIKKRYFIPSTVTQNQIINAIVSFFSFYKYFNYYPN